MTDAILVADTRDHIQEVAGLINEFTCRTTCLMLFFTADQSRDLIVVASHTLEAEVDHPDAHAIARNLVQSLVNAAVSLVVHRAKSWSRH